MQYRHDGQPPQILSLDPSDRMVDVHICGGYSGDVWVFGVYDGCESPVALIIWI